MNTRETLVNLAEDAMRTRGYGGFSYADIARDAGIRKASIHHHFPAKADLGHAVLERYSARLSQQFDRIKQESRIGGQALSAVIDLYRSSSCSGEMLCLCVALSSDIHAIDDKIRNSLQAANERSIATIEDILLTGRRDRSISVAGDPKLEAAAILAILQGAQLMARTSNDPDTFDQATQVLRERIQRG